MRTSEVIGLLEASGVARWMFLVSLRICVYGPPPILNKNKYRDFLGFYEFPLCSPQVCESVIQLSHHFANMVKQSDSTLGYQLSFV